MNKTNAFWIVGLSLFLVTGFVAGSSTRIFEVFVTNWPENQKVTVTNPPVVNINVTAGKPSLDVTFVGARTLRSCALPDTATAGGLPHGSTIGASCPPGLEASVNVSGYGDVSLYISYVRTDSDGSDRLVYVMVGFGPVAGVEKVFISEPFPLGGHVLAMEEGGNRSVFWFPLSGFTAGFAASPGERGPNFFFRFYTIHYFRHIEAAVEVFRFLEDTTTVLTASVYAVE